MRFAKTLAFFLLSVIAESFLIGDESGKLLPKRVAGGVDATHDYPFYVVLLIRNSTNHEHRCGGTFIHQHWVLTAAHCLEDAYKVLIYRDNFRSLERKGREKSFEDGDIKIAEAGDCFIHELYKKAVNQNPDLVGLLERNYDVGLVKLKNSDSVAESNILKPCQDRNFHANENTKLRLIGMGAQNSMYNEDPENLKEEKPLESIVFKQLDFYELDQGKPFEVLSEEQTEGMLCVAVDPAPDFIYSHGHSGDSGSPLFQLDNNGDPTCLEAVYVGKFYQTFILNKTVGYVQSVFVDVLSDPVGNFISNKVGFPVEEHRGPESLKPSTIQCVWNKISSLARCCRRSPTL